jgi:hypothetical protein
MSTQISIDETQIAGRIISALPDVSVTRLIAEDRETIRYAVADRSLKLKTITFSRKSLRRLALDPACAVKIEYLQRDLVRSASRRAEFRYPRENRIVTAIRGRRAVKLARLAVATI